MKTFRVAIPKSALDDTAKSLAAENKKLRAQVARLTREVEDAKQAVAEAHRINGLFEKAVSDAGIYLE